MLHGAAQVGVDDQHLVADRGADVGEVEQRRGFAFAHAAAGHREGAAGHALVGEEQVGAQHTVRLGVGAVRPLFDQRTHLLRDDADDGQPQVALDVVHGLDGGVQILDEVG